MSQDLVWEDAPAAALRPGRRAGGKFGEFAASLRDNAGKTAKLAEFPSTAAARNIAGQIERGKRKGFEPAGAYEASVHETGVWVRYVGDATGEEAATDGDGDGFDDDQE